MEQQYKCTNISCCEENGKEYELLIPDESIMDEKNVAVMYCPQCQCELTRSE